MERIEISLSASLQDWMPDGDGGWDAFWKLSNATINRHNHQRTSDKRRAVDMWKGNDGWAFTIYCPFTESAIYSGHSHQSDDIAKSVAIEFIKAHAHSFLVNKHA